jgi:plasmid stabilization system protein ParE
LRYDVRLTAKAETDVEGVLIWFHHIQADLAGRRWFKKLFDSIATLEKLPERCGLAPEPEELQIELRELLFGNRRNAFRILFQIDGRVIHILHIRRGTRKPITKDDLER